MFLAGFPLKEDMKARGWVWNTRKYSEGSEARLSK